MNAVMRFGMVGLSLFLTSGLGAAQPCMQVQGSRDLRVAIVDSSRKSAAREALHEAFAKSMSAAMTKACHGTVVVKIKCVNPDHAAFNLGTGVYDAVLVIGRSLPRPLMLSEVTRLEATLGAGKEERKAYLIFGDGDQRLGDLLAASFASALGNDQFLNAFDVESGHVPAGGAKIAANP